jgi:hypothetical protein
MAESGGKDGQTVAEWAGKLAKQVLAEGSEKQIPRAGDAAAFYGAGGGRRVDEAAVRAL